MNQKAGHARQFLTLLVKSPQGSRGSRLMLSHCFHNNRKFVQDEEIFSGSGQIQTVTKSSSHGFRAQRTQYALAKSSPPPEDQLIPTLLQVRAAPLTFLLLQSFYVIIYTATVFFDTLLKCTC